MGKNFFLMKKIWGMKIISQFIASDHRRHDEWRRQISWGEIRRRTDEGISESLKRNGIATGPRSILSLIDCDRFRRTADSLPTIQRFRLVGFPRFSQIFHRV